MKTAFIDIGSNSVRLLHNGKKIGVITKLADGIDNNGVLSKDGVERTVQTLRDYINIVGSPRDIFAFATEAVRKSTDGAQFVARVKRELGLDITVLSGEQEAAIALYGAKKPQGSVCVCDLGGGSMELVCSKDGHTADYVKSLHLGVVVLKNKFNGNFRAAIDGAPELVQEYGDTPDYPLVMLGGSACSIAAAILNLDVYNPDAVNGAFISAAALDDNMPLFLSPNLALYRPICEKRKDTVPYGAIIIQALVNKLNANGFYVSDSDNLNAFENGYIL